MRRKDFSKILALVLVMVLVGTIIGIKTVKVKADEKADAIIVTTKKALMKEIAKKSASTIVFESSTAQTITIKSKVTRTIKRAKNKKLIIDAPNAIVKNYLKFKTITIKNAKSISERVNGNKITVQLDTVKFNVYKNINVKKLTIPVYTQVELGKKANITTVKYTKIKPIVTATPTAKPVVTVVPTSTEQHISIIVPTQSPVVTSAPTQSPVVTAVPTQVPIVTQTPTDESTTTIVPTAIPNKTEETFPSNTYKILEDGMVIFNIQRDGTIYQIVNFPAYFTNGKVYYIDVLSDGTINATFEGERFEISESDIVYPKNWEAPPYWPLGKPNPTVTESSTVSPEANGITVESTEVDTTPIGTHEPISEAISETQSEITSEPQSEISSEPRSEVNSETQSEATSEPQSEVTSEPQSEVTSEPQSEVTSEPQSEVTPEPQSEIISEPQSEVSSEPQSEVTSEPQSEVSSEPQSEVTSEPQSEVTSEPQSEITSEPQSVVTPEPTPEVIHEPTPIENVPNEKDYLIDNCILSTTSLLKKYAGEDVDSILNGRIWEEEISIPVDWELKTVLNRSTAYKICGLQFLDSLYFYSLNYTDSNIYDTAIHDYIMDFCLNAPKYGNQSEWPWHDDATAFRMIRLSYYYTLYYDMFSESEKEVIDRILQEHLSILLSDSFYNTRNNHGMHQDEAVIVYSLLICQDKKLQKDYIDKALYRTLQYLENVYTEEGVHKEHSPEYAVGAAEDLDRFRIMVKDIAPDFIEITEPINNNAIEFLIHLIKPDGKYPSLGDSIEKEASEVSVIKNNEWYKYIETNGKDGQSPVTSKVFPKSGYAFFRSSWIDSDNKATWLMFVAATFSHTHKHGDDLSFNLYYGGDFIVEAGKRNYNYTDEKTKWAYSGYGHNVIAIDGNTYASYISDYDKAIKTQILDYNISEESDFVEGQEFRFEGVNHIRSILYDKTKQNIIITDKLDSDGQKTLNFFFHIAKGVEIVRSENGWDFYRDGNLFANMIVQGTSDCHLFEYTENTQCYPWCPWIFNGKDEPEYGTILVGEAELDKGSNIFEYKIELL